MSIGTKRPDPTSLDLARFEAEYLALVKKYNVCVASCNCCGTWVAPACLHENEEPTV